MVECNGDFIWETGLGNLPVMDAFGKLFCSTLTGGFAHLAAIRMSGRQGAELSDPLVSI